MTAVVSVIKLFYLHLVKKPNKLGCFPLASFYSLIYLIQVQLGTLSLDASTKNQAGQT
jgi:hypothetical protein